MTTYTHGKAIAVEYTCHARTSISVDGVIITECTGHGLDTDLCIANAKRLAHCWNHHDELVATVKALLALDSNARPYAAARAVKNAEELVARIEGEAAVQEAK